jgi:DNA-binding transcriptional ArsR family regulator
MLDVDQTMAALADPTRRQIIEHLRHGPQRAGALAKHCRMSAPAMSRHLRLLKASGLVSDEDVEGDARVRLYQLKSDRLVMMRDWITHITDLWEDQLAAFKSYAEQPHDS